MTFPPLDTLDPPQYNGYSNNATRKPRDPSPSTTTTTSPPSRPPRTYSNNSRPRTISTTTSSIGGGQGMPAVKRSDVPTEFYISVELYLPPKASIGLRKVRSSFPPPFQSSLIPLASCQIFHNRPHYPLGRSLPLPFLAAGCPCGSWLAHTARS